MTTATIKSYYANRLDATNFLRLLHKAIVICNSKQQFDTSNIVGKATIADEIKPFMIKLFMIRCLLGRKLVSVSVLTFTKQIPHALAPTLRASSR